jgi:Fur family transcriptional regulator, ferric uptake regulator
MCKFSRDGNVGHQPSLTLRLDVPGNFDYLWRPQSGAALRTDRMRTRTLMALESMEGSLKERGVRLTRQRQILLELIDKTGEHLDAESLFQLAKERDPKINRVTVYRTLKMLKAGGLVDELDLMHYGGDQHYYETRLKQEHAHVICMRCGKVEEFFGEPLQRLRKQIESHFGFQILLARTEVGGYCAHCQALRAREVEALRAQPPEPERPPRRARTARK